MSRFHTIFFDLDDTLYPNNNGLWEAIEVLERKYFRRQFLEQIKSNTYREILDIMASYDEDIVQYAWIKNELDQPKRNILGRYLGNMVKRGTIAKVRAGKPGEYTFPNRVFKLYIRLLSFRESGRRTLRSA